MLGAINVLTEVLLYGTVGVLAGSLHTRFNGSRKASAVLNYIAGCVYLALAIAIAIAIAAETLTGLIPR